MRELIALLVRTADDLDAAVAGSTTAQVMAEQDAVADLGGHAQHARKTR